MMRRFRRANAATTGGRLLTALAMLPLVVSRGALADSAPADQALAQTLFDRGRELMTAKKFAEACEKFEASQRLDPSAGTELNLALCYESQGKTATAWAAYKAVATRARRDGRKDREQVARDRIAALEPKLSRVLVALAPGADLSGLEVRLDGTTLSRATWDIAAPIDPGSHVVEVKAPGHKTWTSRLEADAPGPKQITIPALVVEPATPAPVVAVRSVGFTEGPQHAPGVVPISVAPTPAATAPSAPARVWIGGRFLIDATTVQDVKTGLTWQRNVIPRGAVWDAAAAYCSALRVTGGGWRLPTPEELGSILALGNAPAVDPQAFPQTPAGWFWTANNHPWGAAEATSFTTGVRQPIMSDRPLYVRCVR